MNILTIFADNQALVEEVKKVIRAHFLDEGDRTDDAVSDERLGQIYRARLLGLQKVEEAFKEIATHRTREKAERKDVNPAR